MVTSISGLLEYGHCVVWFLFYLAGNRLITAANFVQNGKYAAAGTYDGRCLLYETEYLKYHTQIHVRSSRGKNARGRKITGIVPMPGEDKVSCECVF